MDMASKPLLLLLLLSFFLILSSLPHLGSSESGLDMFLQGFARDPIEAAKGMQCMPKLLPCQSFLKTPNNPPPEACCLPLKEVVANESECLCTFFNNLEMLRSLNVSKEDALKLPAACGANVDVSECKTEARSPTGKSGTDGTGPAKNTAEDSTSSTKMVTPYGITHFVVPGFAALLTALVFSAH